jgi:hypothetical protein
MVRTCIRNIYVIASLFRVRILCEFNDFSSLAGLVSTNRKIFPLMKELVANTVKK